MCPMWFHVRRTSGGSKFKVVSSLDVADIAIGPKIGEKIPAFSLPDQMGKQRSLHELMGPSGLLLIFSRSADW